MRLKRPTMTGVRFNFPLFLTWCRIVAIPLFVAVLYVPEDWIAEKSRNVISP